MTCEELVVQLSGQSGEVARRWRRFVVNDASVYIPPTVLARYLSFPTPNLEDLRLDKYRQQDSFVFLPDTASLTTFYVNGLDVPTFPNLAATTDLHVCTRGF
jgi:hypothetical protein